MLVSYLLREHCCWGRRGVVPQHRPEVVGTRLQTTPKRDMQQRLLSLASQDTLHGYRVAVTLQAP